MTRWLRIAIGGGAFGLSVLAGVGMGAITDGDSAEPDPLDGVPVAERPTEVLEPLTQGEAPTDENLDALAAGIGGGGGGTGGGGAAPSFTSIGTADAAQVINDVEIPEGLLEVVCGDDADAGCTDFVGRTLDEYADGIVEDATADEDDPEGGEDAEGGDGLIELLCFDPDARDICFDAIGEFRDFIIEGLGEDDGGGGGDDEAPVLIDLCAENPDLPGCEEGVVGTVTLATTIPVEIFSVQSRNELTTLCRSGPAPDADQWVLLVVANQAVAVSGTYAPVQPDGTLGEAGSFSGEATPEAREWVDRFTEDPSTVTCALLPRGGVRTYQIDFEATGDLDAVPASWSGEIDVPTVSTPEPPPEEDDERQRPPTEVTPINARELHVDVYVTPDETASAWLVPRDPENPEASRCGALYAGDLGIREYTPAVIDRLSPVGSATEPYTNQARLWATTLEYRPGPHDVCVEVKDDFDPPRVVDRHRVLVGIPDQLDFEVFVAGYRHTDTGDGADLPRVQSIDLQVAHGFQVCRDTLATSDLVALTSEQSFCSLSMPPDADSVGVIARTQFDSGPGHTRRALLRIPRTGCAGFPPGECPTYYEIQLLGPRDSDSTEKHGVLILGLRPTGTPGSTNWGIGLPEPDDTDEDTGEDELPRLDTGSLTVEVDPDNPTAGIIVNWQADEEVTASIRAVYFPTFADRDVACTNAEGRPINLRTVQQRGVSEGQATFSGLCPGRRYRVDVELLATDEDGRNPRRVLYTSAEGASGEGTRLLDWRRVSARTEPLAIVVEYDVEYEYRTHAGPGDGRSFIPAPLTVEVGDHISGVEQEYNARARLELVCDRLEGLNHVVEPFTTEATGSVIVLVRMRMYRWNNDGGCPNPGDQITQAFAEYRYPSIAGGGGEFIDVYPLLDRGEATLREVTGTGARIVTTVHLTARPAVALSADDSVAEAAG